MVRRLLFVLPPLLLAVAAYVALRGAPVNTAVRFVVYRPITAQFYIDAWTHRGTRLDFEHQAKLMFSFGRPGDIGLACFQSEREEQWGLRVYADGAWYFSPQQSRPPGGDLSLGKPGDVPFCADFDGDGRPDNGVFSGGEWTVRTSSGSQLRFSFGMAADRPVVLNVPGRGNARDRRNVVYGVYRRGIWYIDLDGDGKADATHAFGGQPQDIPLLLPHWRAGQDGGYSLAIFRDGLWFVKADPNDTATTQFYFGAPGDIPSVLY